MTTRSYRDLSQDEVTHAVVYDAATGAFTWATPPRGRVAGDAASRRAANGYLGVTVNGAPVLCHRLAWFIAYGEWPNGDIDHINGVRTDNRLRNLRCVTRAQNMQNLRAPHADSASQVLGAYFDRRRSRWYSSIAKNGRSMFLGCFDSSEEAGAAYIAAKRRLHEACTL